MSPPAIVSKRQGKRNGAVVGCVGSFYLRERVCVADDAGKNSTRSRRMRGADQGKVGSGGVTFR